MKDINLSKFVPTLILKTPIEKMALLIGVFIGSFTAFILITFLTIIF